jgi:glycosyltransferase involved in cell wall biosynthesis
MDVSPMISAALVIALSCFALVFTVYGLYVLLVLRNAKTKDYFKLIDQALTKSSNPQSLPNVTVLIPTYNESAVISRKLQNIAELEYPLEKIEVILVDDCSTDSTCEIAEKMFKELGLQGRVIKNPERMGVNVSYNKGVPSANSNFVLRTDADIVIKPDALEKAVKIISYAVDVGGVTGMTPPIADQETAATRVERSYKTLFDQMAIAESALHSTFLVCGGFALLRKSCFSPISSSRGSTDGNILLSIVKKGFRYIYVPYALSYETISHRLTEQVRQKVRRASRLTQSVLMNRDVMFKKEFQEFGMVIFPLRLAMFTICPILILVGLISTFFLFLSFSEVLCVLLTFALCSFLYLGSKMNIGALNAVTSFFIHQFYLLFGLFFLGKSMRTWKGTSRHQ